MLADLFLLLGFCFPAGCYVFLKDNNTTRKSKPSFCHQKKCIVPVYHPKNLKHFIHLSQRKKCPYLELFWSVFPRIRTEYGKEMPGNTDQNNSIYGDFSCSIFLNELETKVFRCTSLTRDTRKNMRNQKRVESQHYVLSIHESQSSVCLVRRQQFRRITQL